LDRAVQTDRAVDDSDNLSFSSKNSELSEKSNDRGEIVPKSRNRCLGRRKVDGTDSSHINGSDSSFHPSDESEDEEEDELVMSSSTSSGYSTASNDDERRRDHDVPANRNCRETRRCKQNSKERKTNTSNILPEPEQTSFSIQGGEETLQASLQVHCARSGDPVSGEFDNRDQFGDLELLLSEYCQAIDEGRVVEGGDEKEKCDDESVDWEVEPKITWDIVAALDRTIWSSLNSYPRPMDADGFGSAHSGKLAVKIIDDPSVLEGNLDYYLLECPSSSCCIGGGQVYAPAERSAMQQPVRESILYYSRRVSQSMTEILTTNKQFMYLDEQRVLNLMSQVKDSIAELKLLVDNYLDHHVHHSQEHVRFEFFLSFDKHSTLEQIEYPSIPRLGDAIRSAVRATSTASFSRYNAAVSEHVYAPLSNFFLHYETPEAMLHCVRCLQPSTSVALLYLLELAGYLCGGFFNPGPIMKRIAGVTNEDGERGSMFRVPCRLVSALHMNDRWTNLPFALDPAILPELEWTPTCPLFLKQALKARVRCPQEFFTCMHRIRMECVQILKGEQERALVLDTIQVDQLAQIPDESRKYLLSQVCKSLTELYQVASGTILLRKANMECKRRHLRSVSECAGFEKPIHAPTSKKQLDECVRQNTNLILKHSCDHIFKVGKTV
jgi:hypothetical protein